MTQNDTIFSDVQKIRFLVKQIDRLKNHIFINSI